MSEINVFIISWAGQHENAVHIAKQVQSVSDNVRIVFSDPDPDIDIGAPCEVIRRPNDLYWGDKFKACIDACGDNPILVIHADCTYEDWGQLAIRCATVVNEIPMIGVWAPYIEVSAWHLSVTQIAALDNGPLRAVTSTDGIVFYLAAPLVARMRKADYERNVFGRGIETMFACAAGARSLLNVIDTSLTVHHPEGTGYDTVEAHTQLNEFLKQLDVREQIQNILYKSFQYYHGGVGKDPRAQQAPPRTV